MVYFLSKLHIIGRLIAYEHMKNIHYIKDTDSNLL